MADRARGDGDGARAARGTDDARQSMSAGEAASVVRLLDAYDRLCAVAWPGAARRPTVSIPRLRGRADVTAAARAALGSRCAAILAAGGTAPAVALARGGFKLVLAAARGGGAASAGVLERRDYPVAAPFAAHLAQQCLMFAAVLLSADGGDGRTVRLWWRSGEDPRGAG